MPDGMVSPVVFAYSRAEETQVELLEIKREYEREISELK